MNVIYIFRTQPEPKSHAIDAIIGGEPLPMWLICDEDKLNQYRLYIKDLKPVSNVRSCGGSWLFEVLPWEDGLGFPGKLWVCEDAVSEFRSASHNNVKDKRNLYQYLKTQFSDRLTLD